MKNLNNHVQFTGEEDKKGFVFDLNRCTGCSACVMACVISSAIEKQGDDLKPGADTPVGFLLSPMLRDVSSFNPNHYPTQPSFFLSLACNHCEQPACMEHCPALAYSKDPKTGAIVLNSEHCIGCKYCTWACPFDAPKYDEAAGVMHKCDFCVDRLHLGERPACVTACPTDALKIESRDWNLASVTHQVPGFSQTELQPSIRFVPMRERFWEGNSSEISEAYTSEIKTLFLKSLAKPVSKISLKSEWSLFIFTVVFTILIALFTSAWIVGENLPPYLFLGVGGFSMFLSSMHLGQKKRMYRAVFNLRKSWLSREIFFTNAFLGSAGLSLIFMPENQVLAWVTSGFGFMALLSMDRLYKFGMQKTLHSGQTLIIGGFLLSVWSHWIIAAIVMGILTAYLYIQRYRGKPSNIKGAMFLLFLRLILGLAFPLCLMWYQPLTPHWSAWLFTGIPILIGGMLDRALFYNELEIQTPSGKLISDLKATIVSQ